MSPTTQLYQSAFFSMKYKTKVDSCLDLQKHLAMGSNMTNEYLSIATENMSSYKEHIVMLAKSYTMYKIGKL